MEKAYTVIDSRTKEETAFTSDDHCRYRTGLLESVPNTKRLIAWHWHAEIECFYLRKGSITFHLPGGEFPFHAGDVGFINAGVLHQVTTRFGEEFCLVNHIFLPQLISAGNSLLEAQYITPLTHNAAATILIFRNGTEEAKKLRALMDEAHEAHTNQAFGHKLIVRDCMSRVWMLMVENMPAFTEQSDNKDALRLMVMLQYIGEHYAEKLDLSSIAAAAHISSKECERCFQKQIKMTPFEYIMDYRLEKARGLLAQKSPAGVTEIGLQCGFATTSYFGKRFKEKYKLSPREYRVKMQNTAE